MDSIEKAFPAVRACIFDLGGLLINSEDVITRALNQLLEKHDRPVFTPSMRSKLMGVPGSSNGDLFHEWAQLPISREQWSRESKQHVRLLFRDCEPLPGAHKILSDLSRACSSSSGDKIELALASSTSSSAYELKTSRPETHRLLDFFQPERRVLGDDPRVRKGRGKPAPDIYLLALELLNSAALGTGKMPIRANECLVFEDSVVGVEAGRRAGMRVVWVPHHDVAVEFEAIQKDILAGRMGMFKGGDSQPGDIDDGWAESIPTLEHFNYEHYGINVPS